MNYTVYRAFDSQGTLLYVGQSVRLPARIRRHREVSSWWNLASRIEIWRFATFEDMRDAEAAAIRDEEPVFNIAHPLVHDSIVITDCVACGHPIIDEIYPDSELMTRHESCDVASLRAYAAGHEAAGGGLHVLVQG